MATRAPKASATPREATVKSAPAQSSPAKTAVKSTPARNTTVPPKAKAATKSSSPSVTITREMIAERAYHLWLAGTPGGEFDHWCAAERELNAK